MVEGAGPPTRWRRGDVENPFDTTVIDHDASFYFTNAARVYGKSKIDLTVDPAPELVIEVDVSSPSAKKKPLYGRLGVAEVWLYRKRLHIFHLEGRTYVDRSHSLAFPWLSGAQIGKVLAEARTIGPRRARKAFERWIRSLTVR